MRVVRRTFVAAAIAAAALVPFGLANAGGQKDIVDTAVGAGNFTSLVKAVQTAGLVETLKGPGPFTVFAPTDEAFAKLPANVLATLLDGNHNKELAAVLTYHVIPGKVMSADIAGKKTEAATVQGAAAMIDATDGVKIEGANVVTADIEASNGVIHVIDTVILPPAMRGSF
ncbi:MAG: fasciclin domain-containing protein [Rhizobiales bacterium]|nr:fasciclin domain-containing protein [Hyphomicrobiales bacterium]